MNLYFAGKVGDSTNCVKALIARLGDLGYRIEYDWTEETTVRKPYLDHPEVNVIAAEKMRQAAVDCDHFILLADDKLLGAYIEFGLALGSTSTKLEKMLFVVLNESSRQSIFYTEPSVVICANVEDLLEKLPKP